MYNSCAWENNIYFASRGIPEITHQFPKVKYLKGNGLVWLSCKQQVLPASVRWFNSLFVRRHKPMAWYYSFCDFWIINLSNKIEMYFN